MARIAISYRRSDSQDITGRIFDRLVQHFGKDTVFRDIDSIQPGIDFRTQIAAALGATDVLLVVVGPAWLGRGKGTRGRLDADKRKTLAADENAWIAQRHSCKSDVACIGDVYLKRIKILEAWQ